MREGILKVNKDNVKVWDGSAMRARYSAKKREETRRNAKEHDGTRWDMKGKMIGSLIYLESDLHQKQGRTPLFCS